MPVVADGSDCSTRDLHDKQASMGRSAHAVGERAAASLGKLSEVQPAFTDTVKAVPNGGVLAALPTLLRQGLLRHATQHLSLPDGYYRLTTVLLFVTLLTLARVRNPEEFCYQAHSEWGQLMGLDRAPEVKTLRHKLSVLSRNPDTIRNWQAQLTEYWMQDIYWDRSTGADFFNLRLPLKMPTHRDSYALKTLRQATRY